MFGQHIVRRKHSWFPAATEDRYQPTLTDGHNFHQNPNAVHDVVFPADPVQRDRVHVGVKEHSEANHQLLKGNSLGPLLVREDLDEVGIGQCVPAHVVEAVFVISPVLDD